MVFGVMTWYPAPKAISDAAKQNAGDLLVIGRSCNGRSSCALGSHAYSILCSAPGEVVNI